MHVEAQPSVPVALPEGALERRLVGLGLQEAAPAPALTVLFTTL